MIRIIYLLCLGILLIARQILIIVLYFLIKNIVNEFRKLSFIEKAESMNIYTTIGARNEKYQNSPLIILSAHYDSFCALIPYKIKKVITYIFRFFVLIYLLILLFIMYNPNTNEYNLQLVVWSLIFLVVLIPLLYLIIEVSYKSSGSIDNASGTAILIELAKILKKDPLKNTDVLFIWCGAEEWGLKGSKRFCKKHYDRLNQEYDLSKSVNINIDMVGTYLGVLGERGLIRKKQMNRDLNNILITSAKQLDIDLKVFSKRIEPKGDHVSFRSFSKKPKKNFQVCLFQSDKDSKYIHSVRDTPDKCSKEILNDCLNTCLSAIRTIDFNVKHS